VWCRRSDREQRRRLSFLLCPPPIPDPNRCRLQPDLRATGIVAGFQGRIPAVRQPVLAAAVPGRFRRQATLRSAFLLLCAMSPCLPAWCPLGSPQRVPFSNSTPHAPVKRSSRALKSAFARQSGYSVVPSPLTYRVRCISPRWNASMIRTISVAVNECHPALHVQGIFIPQSLSIRPEIR